MNVRTEEILDAPCDDGDAIAAIKIGKLKKQAENPQWWLFQKGRKKTGGRVNGIKNKKTQAVVDALESTFDGLGGDEALKAFAKDNPDEFYKLWIRMLPKEVKADITSNGQTICQPILADDAMKMIKELQK